jgi:uncharacterized protein
MTAPSASPARAVAGGPVPVDSDERLHALDILRGFALAGMILVHFHQRVERPVNGAEDLIAWGIWILVEQKAWGTFAFLFGAGFAVLLRRLEARGAAVIPLYLRRLAGLALIGIVVQVGFGFHILLEYACWGLVLFLVRRWSTRALLVLAGVAACAWPVIAEITALYAWKTGAPMPAPLDRTLVDAVTDAAQHGTYAALLAARWALFIAEVPRHWRDFVPDSNLTLFVLGALAIRHRVLDEPLRHVRLIRGWMIFGATSWAISWTLLRSLPTVPFEAADWPIKEGFGLVQDQWLCLAYVGAVVLLLAYRPGWVGRLRGIGIAGRMALTNYLLQAAFFDVFGSRYGLGLRVRPYVYVLLMPAFFAVQVLLSRWWLAHYRFGPFEWLWRSITYARLQPLRRTPVAARTPAAVG